LKLPTVISSENLDNHFSKIVSHVILELDSELHELQSRQNHLLSLVTHIVLLFCLNAKHETLKNTTQRFSNDLYCVDIKIKMCLS